MDKPLTLSVIVTLWSTGVRETFNLLTTLLIIQFPPHPSIILPLIPFGLQLAEACTVQMLLPVGESDGFNISKVLRGEKKNPPHYFNCQHQATVDVFF